MRQLDKLLEIVAQENKLTKHELFIKGQDLTFWSKPPTISEYQLAKKQSKDPEGCAGEHRPVVHQEGL